MLTVVLPRPIPHVFCEGIINCLIITNSKEANVQLTRIHDQLFAREFFLSANTTLKAWWLTATHNPTYDSAHITGALYVNFNSIYRAQATQLSLAYGDVKHILLRSNLSPLK